MTSWLLGLCYPWIRHQILFGRNSLKALCTGTRWHTLGARRCSANARAGRQTETPFEASALLLSIVCCKSLTESGEPVKLVNKAQFLNASNPMEFAELEMVKLLRERHSANAQTPMDVTDSGIVKLVKELQPENA